MKKRSVKKTKAATTKDAKTEALLARPRTVESDRECRVCKKRPGKFYASRAVRHDWICGKCMGNKLRERRGRAEAEMMKAVRPLVDLAQA